MKNASHTDQIFSTVSNAIRNAVESGSQMPPVAQQALESYGAYHAAHASAKFALIAIMIALAVWLIRRMTTLGWDAWYVVWSSTLIFVAVLIFPFAVLDLSIAVSPIGYIITQGAG